MLFEGNNNSVILIKLQDINQDVHKYASSMRTMLTKISNSVRDDVRRGRHLGSKLLGVYFNLVEYNQDRCQLLTLRLIRRHVEDRYPPVLRTRRRTTKLLSRNEQDQK